MKPKLDNYENPQSKLGPHGYFSNIRADIDTISEQQFLCLIEIAKYGGKELTGDKRQF